MKNNKINIGLLATLLLGFGAILSLKAYKRKAAGKAEDLADSLENAGENIQDKVNEFGDKIGASLDPRGPLEKAGAKADQLLKKVQPPTFKKMGSKLGHKVGEKAGEIYGGIKGAKTGASLGEKADEFVNGVTHHADSEVDAEKG